MFINSLPSVTISPHQSSLHGGTELRGENWWGLELEEAQALSLNPVKVSHLSLILTVFTAALGYNNPSI